MRTTTYSCDNCGRPIDLHNDGVYNVSIQGLGAARRLGSAGDGAHSDLCVDCLDTLPPAVRHGWKQATS